MSKIAITYGRFNPPTIAHEMLFKQLKNYSVDHSCDMKIYTSHSNDKNKNPLSIERKLYYLNEFFPEYEFVATTKERPSIFNILTDLNLKYTEIVIFVGSDRKDKFEKDLNYYNKKEYNFNTIEVISIGNREQVSNNIIETCSGTLVRNLVKQNDFNLFCNYIPTNNLKLKILLWDELKNLMK